MTVVWFLVLSVALFASGYFTLRMRSWFLAAVNWIGAFVALLVCILNLLTENGDWIQFGTVGVVAVAEAICSFVAFPV